ncbi:hypothetical protein PspLS_03067 [Pyricularia sp. CBS 133598]|nr:hypothetical protein PspLS_03067 [Pyricularia sp. CBS 133598]
MKDRKDVITEFNSLVNMTASDLESWLKSDDSNSAGWPKDGGDDEGGETVGHDSGRKIVEILKANPDKKEDEYTDEQVEHMRKVVSYCKRHLAQESKGNSEKSEEELKKTKSYASLKNWGHDILKVTEGKSSENGGSDSNDESKDAGHESKKGSASNGKSKPKSPSQTPKRQTRSAAKDVKANEDEEEDDEEYKEQNEEDDEEYKEENEGESQEEEDEVGDNDESTAQSGQKRKAANGKQNGARKKQQTSKGAGVKKQSTEDEAEEADNDDDGGDEEQDEEMVDGDEDEQGEEEPTNGKQAGDKDDEAEAGEKEDNEDGEEEEEEEDESSGKGDAKNGPSKGDTVSWKWGNNHPEGKVLDVKEEDTSITTKNGNQVSRKGTKDDPAVVLDAGKSKAIKKAHELD